MDAKKYFDPQAIRAISVSGKDALEFLHRLTTANVKKLPVGKGTKSLLLTGASLVIAPFYLHRTGPDKFFLFVESAVQETLLRNLENLHFSEQLSLELVAGKGYRCFGAIDFSNIPEDLLISWQEDKTCLHSVFAFSEASAKEIFSEQGLWVNPDPNFWLSKRIQAAIPAYEKEWTHESKALDVGFESWIHRDKGCYPGQEVVEKSLNLGHPARALVKLRKSGSGDEARGDTSLYLNGKEIGKITSEAILEHGGLVALAVVQWAAKARGNIFKAASGEFRVIDESEILDE